MPSKNQYIFLISHVKRKLKIGIYGKRVLFKRIYESFGHVENS